MISEPNTPDFPLPSVGRFRMLHLAFKPEGFHVPITMSLIWH